jgi:hypothetical protein
VAISFIGGGNRGYPEKTTDLSQFYWWRKPEKTTDLSQFYWWRKPGVSGENH